MNKKVMVGMSGGVDSAVAALLLKQQGYDVTGVTLKLQPENYLNHRNQSDYVYSEDVKDAKLVAKKLNINHVVLDFTQIFEENVIENFVAEYCIGRTPNPCVVCNKFLKFGAMFEYAMDNGFDYIATGHYAINEFDKIKNRWLLKRAKSSKDQSYVLYNLTQNHLAHTLFPLGKLEKSEIRNIAKKFGLIVAEKPESQEICFVKNETYKDFINKNFKITNTIGNFIDKNGNILGQHIGLLNYTIGQRKGLGGTFGKPMYVTKINSKDNTVVLGENIDLYHNELIAKDVNFIPFEGFIENMDVTAQVRYKAKPEKAKITSLPHNKVKAVFELSQRAITPGQSVVFYKEDIVIGGGIIV